MSEDTAALGKDVKIGELLTGVGVVNSGDLQEAIQIAKRMNLPIGRVIVMSGVITEQNLQSAIEAQSLVRDGLLDFDTAITALKASYKKDISLQEALAELRWAPKADISSNRLGELLVDSAMVSQHQLDSALHASFETGMPLGGTLVIQGVLSAQLLPMVLTAQEQIRDGKITRNEAVETLKAAVMFWAKADEVANKSTYHDTVFDATTGGTTRAVAGTGDLPVRSQTAERPQPHRGNVPRTSGNTTRPPAGIDLSLVDMMKFSGFCSEQDIQTALERALSNSEIASRLFMATGLLNQPSLDNFIRCRSLIRRNVITQEQALEALAIWHSQEITLEEAFIDLGLTVPNSGW
ncbi:MAG: hypothetical protein K2W95_21500 [Candidatus Obscuribacterales bacterium]|nr:hypothetical protein [Candidatus Obscuribacterales bacterium]